ncbi:MAG: hypothetical protein KJ063_07185 [Anaerolineae bacterium]|nr:hypothetical protein [Anaerolineae bacterium]
MPLLHMETDTVRTVGQQLNQATNSIQQHSQQLAQSAQTLVSAWEGNAANLFTNEIQLSIKQISLLAESGTVLNQRLQREILEWEQVAAQLGNGLLNKTGNAILLGQETISNHLPNINPDSAITPAQQQKLLHLEEKYYQIFNQMKAEQDEIYRLYEELEQKRQEGIDNGVEILFSIALELIKTGQTPTPYQVLSLVGKSSIKSVKYAAEAVDWAYQSMKVTDKYLAIQSSLGDRYTAMGKLAEQIQQIDPKWSPPNIYS